MTTNEIDHSLHKAAYEGNLELLKDLILKNNNIDLDIYDKNGNTALILAIHFKHHDVVKSLLQSGANSFLRSRSGWSPLTEAIASGETEIVTMIHKTNLRQQRMYMIRSIPAMISSLKKIPDFYTELRWEFKSWIPFVTRFCPSDTYKIWKKGANFRVDTTLVGYDNLKWLRGNLSLIFREKKDCEDQGELVIVDYDHKQYEVATNLDLDDQEDEIQIRKNLKDFYSQKLVTTQTVTSNCRFEPVNNWHGVKKEETINGYKCTQYLMDGLLHRALVRQLKDGFQKDLNKSSNNNEKSKRNSLWNIRKSRKHEMSNDDDGDGDDDPPCSSDSSEYVSPIDQSIGDDLSFPWDQYYNSSILSSGKIPLLYKNEIITGKERVFKGTIYVTKEFTRKPTDFLPIFEAMFLSNQPVRFEKLVNFIKLKMPEDGFPLMFELPVFPTVTGKATFLTYKECKNNEIDDKLFLVPQGFARTKIIKELEYESLKHALLINKEWSQIVLHPSIWKYLFYKQFGGYKGEDSWKYAVISCFKQMSHFSTESKKLTWAIKSHHLSLIKKIVESNPDITRPRSNRKRIPIYIAAQFGSKEIVKYLLERGDDPNVESCDGSTPLYIAAQEGNIDAVKLLIKYGADTECVFREGYTPLYIASQNGRIDVVKFLLKCGARVDAKCAHGSTPLYIAAQQGRYEVSKILVEVGSNIEASFKTGFTPLYVAARNGHADVLDLLLSLGAYTEANEGDGSTPLYVAAQNGHADCVNLLLKYGADYEATFLDEYTPLYISSQNGHTKVVASLCKKGANVNRVCGNGSTSLYVASQNGHYEVAKILLEYGARTDAVFGGGYTPLYIASQKGHHRICRLLNKYNADINYTTNKGATALYVAAQKCHLNVVKCLIKNGADIEKSFQNGFTPLHIASQENSISVVSYLLQMGANPFSRSSLLQTPADIAVSEELIQLLRAYERITLNRQREKAELSREVAPISANVSSPRKKIGRGARSTAGIKSVYQ